MNIYTVPFTDFMYVPLNRSMVTSSTGLHYSYLNATFVSEDTLYAAKKV